MMKDSTDGSSSSEFNTCPDMTPSFKMSEMSESFNGKYFRQRSQMENEMILSTTH